MNDGGMMSKHCGAMERQSLTQMCGIKQNEKQRRLIADLHRYVRSVLRLSEPAGTQGTCQPQDSWMPQQPLSNISQMTSLMKGVTYMSMRHAKPPISIKPTAAAISIYLHITRRTL